MSKLTEPGTRRMVMTLAGCLSVGLVYLGWQHLPTPLPPQWNPQELALLRSLSLSTLPPVPSAPGNAVADNPEAASFGHQLFFDTRLSVNGLVSCATCHRPELNFTDQLPRGVAVGTGDRNTMSLVGVAYSPWLFWDGRKDSLWAQALEPMENPIEHGTNRLELTQLISSDQDYRDQYQQLFGALPVLKNNPDGADQMFANIGKVLASYQRLLLPGPSRFDEYADSLGDTSPGIQSALMSDEELSGLRLFIGKARCVNCHNGPLFTNNSFHNTGVLPAPGLLPALGRSEGLRTARKDEFNCEGEFSDAPADACLELRFAKSGDELIGAQRTPSLRNLAKTAPYMHAGQIPTLAKVIEHYDDAELAVIGHNEAEPIGLRAVEKQQLRSFLQVLNSPLATDERWLQPPTRQQ